MALPLANASIFKIRELSGDGRTVEMGTRALPYRPIKFGGGAMRAEVTWYPGSGDGTIQVLGPKLKPSTFRGFWKDRFIKNTDADGNAVSPEGILTVNGSQVADVMAAYFVLEDIRQKGQQVEVTWDEIVRQGILTEWDPTWHRREDLEWEMTFEWNSTGIPPTPVGFSAISVPEDFLAKLNSHLDNISQKMAEMQAKFEIAEDFISNINETIDNISTTADAITGAISQGVDVILSPAQVAKNVLNGIERVRDQAQDIIDQFGGVQPQDLLAEASALGTAPEDIGDVSFGDTTSLAALAYAVSSEARDLRDAAIEDSDSFNLDEAQEDLLAVFEAADATDLRDVSTQFYGTPDQWRDLAIFNGIPTSKLSAGDVVLVPKLRTGGSAT